MTASALMPTNNMIVFISGGSGCGKSAYAESVAMKLGGEKIYVATMPVFSEEDEKTVARHHALRAGKGFETLERPGLLSDLPCGEETMLLECVSTHVANILFGVDPDTVLRAEDVKSEQSQTASACVAFEPNAKNNSYITFIQQELTPLLNRAGHTIFVSADVSKDGVQYDAETERYRFVLSQVNDYLAQHADVVAEVVCGIPVCIKGELPC